MNISKRKVYVVPEVRIVKVCQENLMGNLGSWNDGWGNKNTIIEGNPGGESDLNPNPDPYPYAEWY